MISLPSTLKNHEYFVRKVHGQVPVKTWIYQFDFTTLESSYALLPRIRRIYGFNPLVPLKQANWTNLGSISLRISDVGYYPRMFRLFTR